MTSPYTRAMDDLRFSPAQLATLAQRLETAAALTSEPTADNPGAPATARAPEPDRSRRPRAPRRLAAILLAAALTLGAAGLAAAATSGKVDASALLSMLFGVPAEQTKELDSLVSTPVATSTSNGVTITLDATVDDGRYLACLFSATCANGGEPGHTCEFAAAEMGINPSLALVSFDTSPPDNPVDQPSKEDPRQRDSPHAWCIQFIDTHDKPADCPATYTVHIELVELVSLDWSWRKEGSWSFDFEQTVSQEIRRVELNTRACYDNCELYIQTVTISPITLSATFQASGGIPEISLIPMSVLLADGSAITQADPSLPHVAGGSRSPGGPITGELGITFSQLIDPADVVAVQIGDATIPVP